jgi:hypothetical protein
MLDNYNYKKASEEFIPHKIKCLFIAESPPKDYRNFFYYAGDEKGNYMFFQNIIFATLGVKYQRTIYDKKHLLTDFKDLGFYLIDSVEFPINSLNNDERKKILVENKSSLKDRLMAFKNSGLIDSKTVIILIKKLVCEILKDYIDVEKDIFFNREFGIQCIGYPICYSDPNFIKKLNEIILKVMEDK